MNEKIKELIADQLRIDAATIEESASIIEDLGADSLDIVELLMAIEENLGVNVPDEDISSLKTVSDIINYVESHS